MRNGNRIFEVPIGDLKGVIIHRGVSQGGRKLSPKKRLSFWRKNAKKVNGAVLDQCARFTRTALTEMRRRNLVLVVNPEKPQVWTPARIEKFGKKFTITRFSPRTSSSIPRRGGLQL